MVVVWCGFCFVWRTEQRKGRETLLSAENNADASKTGAAAAAASTATKTGGDDKQNNKSDTKDEAATGSAAGSGGGGGGGSSSEGFCTRLLALLSDPDVTVRQNTYGVWSALLAVVDRTSRGVELVLALGGIDILINKAGDESSPPLLKRCALDVLAQLLVHERAFTACLSSGLVLTLTRLLRDETLVSPVVASACKCVALIGIPIPGKKYCVIAGCVGLVIRALKDESSEVRMNAAHALMVLTIDLKAKSEALAVPGGATIKRLLQLIDSPAESDTLRAYALHAVAHISEADHKSSPIADADTRAKMEALANASNPKNHPLVTAAAKCVITVLNKL